MTILNRRATRLSRSLVRIVAAAALLPMIAQAYTGPEDPKVTTQMREKVAGLRKAYSAGDAKAYAAELSPLLKDAVQQSPGDLVKRYTALEVIAKDGLDGLQPMIYRYARSIFAAGSKIDPKTISQLRESLALAQSTLGSGLEIPCARVVRDALMGNLPDVSDLAGLSCLSADLEVHGYSLSTGGLTLPAHDACESLPPNLVYRLDIPSSIPSASISTIEVVDLPFPATLASWQDWANKRWVSVSKVQFGDPLPAWAQTESFTVRVTTSTGVTNLPVTFPINRGIHHSCSNNPVDVGIGNTWNWPIYGNGPRGARAWTASAGLPAGLTFSQGTGTLAGHGVVTGTVQPSAVNGVVDFAFTQGAITTTRRYSFKVALRADPARVAELSAVQTIVRGQVISLALPAASGASGAYLWAVAATSTPLPPGLSLVQSGTNWFVSGTVDSHAPLDMRTVRLVLSSAGQNINLSLIFDARRPLNIYTQNMILFPPDIVDPFVDCLPAWAGGFFAYGACVALFQAGETFFYDQGIHNTASDNEERANYLVDHINAQQFEPAGRYDVIALQEVWDGPLTDAELDHIVNDTSAGYRAVQGAGTSFGVIPPDFKISSGLLTLVKRPASAVNQPSPTDHSEVFSNRGPGIDSFANKGFVATQVFVTDDPGEFVWVINTHAHAGDASTRAAQIQQIQSFVTTLPATNPVLLLGDLNVESDENYNVSVNPSSEYAGMRSILAGFQDLALGRGLITDDWYHNAYSHEWGGEQPAKRIDYILVRQGSVFELDLDTISVVNSLPQVMYTSLCIDWNLPSAILCHYSDHFGLRAHLKFRHR
jgi:endonuclease/exonuclease/phosphatase family metal-dependent hydrolase